MVLRWPGCIIPLFRTYPRVFLFTLPILLFPRFSPTFFGKILLAPFQPRFAPFCTDRLLRTREVRRSLEDWLTAFTSLNVKAT